MRRLVLALTGLLFASFASAQTVNSFTATPNSGASPLTFTLAWNASGPAGTTCTASDGWSGTKALVGSQVITGLLATNSYTLTCQLPGGGSATVTWTPPTQNTDGSTLTDLAGYKLFHASTSAGVDTAAGISVPLGTSFTINGLPNGTRWFGMKAVNAQGTESNMSVKASKLISIPSDSRTVTVTVNTVPNPPVLQTITSLVYEQGNGNSIGSKVVGTVPLGTACGVFIKTKNGVNYYSLERNQFTLTVSTKATEFVGVCAPSA